MKIEVGRIETTLENLAQEYAKIFPATKASLATDTDDAFGGFLIPPEYTVELAVRFGMPHLPKMLRWSDFVYAKIKGRPWWWKWLFDNYTVNKIASFLVWRWPKFPNVVTAYSEVCRAMHRQQEARTIRACEFFYDRLRKQ